MVTAPQRGAGRSGPALAAIALLVVGATAWASEDEARTLLERMTRALRTLNYDATLVYRAGDAMQAMRVIHRFADGAERERLVALSGAPREVLRDEAGVTCILPDDRTVVVASRRDAVAPGASRLEPRLGFERYYRLRVEPGRRIAGRRTRLVVIEPPDGYRYGYRVSLDVETGLPLATETVTGEGRLVEQIVYTSLATPREIPDELLRPAADGRGYTWLVSRVKHERAAGAGRRWAPSWLPPGFEPMDMDDPLSMGRAPVRHRMYGDGLATVSLFIEPLAGDRAGMEGGSRAGALSTFSLVRDGHQVTAVGEVPAGTVERIARSVGPR